MIETVTAEDYDEEVTEHATRLAEYAEEDVERDTAYDDHHSAIVDLSRDVLDGHKWLARSHFGPAAHGCIIEYATEAGADASLYGDVEAYVDGGDIPGTVERLAFVLFEAHVIERAKGLVTDGDE